MIQTQYQQCSFCVMDTTDPEIEFFEDGCTYCKRYKENIPQLPQFQSNSKDLLNDLVAKIKNAGKHKKYDCLIGLSGGVDSSYVAYYVKNILGLRPLALHLDNGWNDELAVHNIEKILRKLDIDLWTEVLDWDEFRSLQMAFLKASVPDCEIPTDHAIVAALYKIAHHFNIKYILVGNNLVTESIMPHTWSRGHGDWMYISNINKKHGTSKLKTFPHYNFLQSKWRDKFSSIKKERILSYINFNKTHAAKILNEELDWQPYSGKHHESVYTKFYQTYWLPQKFGYDKRKGHLSALVCAGQMTREDALDELKKSPISDEETQNLKEYIADKFDITIQQLEEWFKQPNRSFFNFSSYKHCWQYYALRAVYRITLKPLVKLIR